MRDHFRMFFVLRRPTGDTTVEVVEWTWVGLASNVSPGDPNPTFELDTTASRVIPQTGSGRRVSDKPVLSPHVFDLRFTADRSSLPPRSAVRSRTRGSLRAYSHHHEIRRPTADVLASAVRGSRRWQFHGARVGRPPLRQMQA